MIITITGDLGSGKSSVAKELSDKLNYGFLSTGKLFREIAIQKGLDVLELSSLAKKDTTIDDVIDHKLKAFDQDDFVIDSRMAWHFIKNSFKIYIQVETLVAAKRIIEANRDSEKYETIEAAVLGISARKEEERERYQTLYGVDITCMENYDYILDSSNLNVNEVVHEIMEVFNHRKEK